MSKLIVIRGNSGSGKTSIAKGIKEKLPNRKVALIEQDYLRRKVLGEIGKGGNDNVGLIKLVTSFAVQNGYITILEGILNVPYYEEMLKELEVEFRDSHFFYLDIPFEETLRRHGTKDQRNDFGEDKMREWYREKDLLKRIKETIIDHKSSLEESINFILKDCGLK